LAVDAIMGGVWVLRAGVKVCRRQGVKKRRRGAKVWWCECAGGKLPWSTNLRV
jgi:hypothetical protein